MLFNIVAKPKQTNRWPKSILLACMCQMLQREWERNLIKKGFSSFCLSQSKMYLEYKISPEQKATFASWAYDIFLNKLGSIAAAVTLYNLYNREKYTCRLLPAACCENLWIFTQIFAFNFAPHKRSDCQVEREELWPHQQLELPLSHWCWQLHKHRPKAAQWSQIAAMSSHIARLRLRYVEVIGQLCEHHSARRLCFCQLRTAERAILLQETMHDQMSYESWNV